MNIALIIVFSIVLLVVLAWAIVLSRKLRIGYIDHKSIDTWVYPQDRDAGIVHRTADVLTPIDPIGEMPHLGAGPELALGRTSA